MGRPGLARGVSEGGTDEWDARSTLTLDWSHSSTRLNGHRDQTTLAGIIENDIIPRLLRTHESGAVRELRSSGLSVAEQAERIAEFTEIVLQQDVRMAMEYFEMLRSRGAPIEVLFNELLAPTARRLGELWDRDIRDFTDVTRGVDHIQQVVMSYCSTFCNEGSQTVANQRVLLMPLPGERHNLGVCIVRAHFWRDGWDVWCDTPSTMKDLAALVRQQWFDVIGFSASRLPDPEGLRLDVKKIRKASANKGLTILVGGHAFFEDPALVAIVGADGTASDGREAVKCMAERLRLRELNV